MKQQHRIAATGLGVGAQQGAHPAPHVHRRGQGIGDGSGGADRGARAAAHTQMRVHHDAAALALGVGHRVGITALLAHGFTLELGIAPDGQSRTHVNTGRAANLLVAAVGAQVVLVFEELGLFKHAHQAPQLQHGLVEPGRIAPRVQIALRRRMLGKGRGLTQIQHHVKRGRALTGFTAELDGPHCVASRDTGAV